MLKPIESADRSLPREIIILGFRGRADAENCSPTVSFVRRQGFPIESRANEQVESLGTKMNFNDCCGAGHPKEVDGG
jgi:hypothetical protein